MGASVGVDGRVTPTPPPLAAFCGVEAAECRHALPVTARAAVTRRAFY